jgi:predicted enzyme related to lactoylglutathione lyase
VGARPHWTSYDAGALCRTELVTTDVEQARSFFGDLLGWE